MELHTRQPTMRLANTSMTKATYSQPRHVDTYVKSETHSWFGRPALNWQLILSSRHEADASGIVVRCGLATPHALQALVFHEPLDCAARHCVTFPAQLPPDFVSAIDLHIGLPDPFDFWIQHVVAWREHNAIQDSSAVQQRVYSPTGQSATPCRSARPP
jgi:hypothetical protein